jgi:alpha-L-fucosidase
MEYYAFVHFGPNTFTGEEWGHGTEDPRVFAPKRLDCRQWARTFRRAGMRGVILTAKHHDGYCLWPSKQSTHTVARSPWKKGHGDVLRELSDACRAEGLKFGVYLSPWDRNHPTYGTPAYNDTFVAMLREVLTGYGPVFEVWFDGANGEGPNGKRQVYDWPRFIQTVRECQPNAVIFSDAGPDIRWVGNEGGYAGETNWATLRRDEFFPGTPRYRELTSGHEDGTHWVPTECDVSIRPGWFWRASEDAKVKSTSQLMDIWYGSVGRGGSLLLNVPPNAEGRVSGVDATRLLEFRRARDREFRRRLAVRAASGMENAANAVDGKPETFASGQTLRLDFGAPRTFDRVLLAEAIGHGQRVKSFEVRVEEGGAWRTVAEGTTINRKRLLRISPQRARRVEVVVRDAKATPRLSEVAFFRAAD